MDTPLTFTERELKEIQHAIYYVENCNHGTVGHNLLVLVAKMADAYGFRLTRTGQELETPPDVEIVKDK